MQDPYATKEATYLASPGATHMHNATMRIVDRDHLTGAWQLFEGGRLKSTENFRFTRIR